jgi:hypothetical protein
MPLIYAGPKLIYGVNMRKVRFITALVMGLFGFLLLTPAVVSQPLFQGTFGISPNTMGTVGVNGSLTFTPFKIFSVSAAISQDNLLQEQIEYDKSGVTVLGNIGRDTTIIYLKPQVNFSLGPFHINPYAIGYFKLIGTYRIGRNVAAGYPQDTYGFLDVTEGETILDLGAGVDIAVKLGGFSIEAGGNYSPYATDNYTNDLFQEYPQYAEAAYYDYVYRRIYYEIEGTGQSMNLNASVGGNIPFITTRVSAVGAYRYSNYLGNTQVQNSWWYPYDNAGTTDFDVYNSSLDARITLEYRELEVGASFILLFFEEVFKLPGSPVIDVSYVRTYRKNNFRYLEGDLSPESWSEDFSYVKFGLSFHI